MLGRKPLVAAAIRERSRCAFRIFSAIFADNRECLPSSTRPKKAGRRNAMASDIPQLRTPGEREALDAMPLPVRRATEAVGWRTLCDSTEPEFSRAQWVKTYDAIVGRVQHERLLPAPMRALLEQIALK